MPKGGTDLVNRVPFHSPQLFSTRPFIRSLTSKSLFLAPIGDNEWLK